MIIIRSIKLRLTSRSHYDRVGISYNAQFCFSPFHCTGNKKW